MPDTWNEPIDAEGRPHSTACLYSAYYPVLIEEARQCGYALAIHGSVRRDMDLIAVPWTEDATSADVLIERLRAATDGFPGPANTVKPHGRRAYVIGMHSNLYLDISVMPMVPREEQPHA